MYRNRENELLSECTKDSFVLQRSVITDTGERHMLLEVLPSMRVGELIGLSDFLRNETENGRPIYRFDYGINQIRLTMKR
jgi:hypothetical protein